MTFTRHQFQAAATLALPFLVSAYLLHNYWGVVVDFFTYWPKLALEDGPRTIHQIKTLIAKGMVMGGVVVGAISLPLGVLEELLKRCGTPLGPLVSKACADTRHMMDTRARREAAQQQAQILDAKTCEAHANQSTRRL